MVMIDAFGTIALVAMTPTVSIQIVGLMYKLKLRRTEGAAAVDDTVIDMPEIATAPDTDSAEEIEIIEFSLDSLSVAVKS